MAVDLQREVGEWGDRTFPLATTGSIVGHLLEEVEEIDQSRGVEQMAEECADAYLMLLHLAHRFGFDLQDAARVKFALVKNARWEYDPARGYSKRVKAPPPTEPPTGAGEGDTANEPEPPKQGSAAALAGEARR